MAESRGTNLMQVCVLQPDYSGSTVGYRHFDPPRNLSSLLPECAVENLFLRKAVVYKQLREAAGRRFDIFVNLCEGYLEWDVPSIDVIWALEALHLPYTGPCLRLYDPSKSAMKYVAYTKGVRFPAFVEAACPVDAARALEELPFPLFVKPAHAGDSLGVDAASCVNTEAELRAKCAAVIGEFGSALIEEFVPGREFTVLVAARPDDPFDPVVLRPIEFVFPPGERFKTYTLKVEQHHPACHVPVADTEIERHLRQAARDIFVGFQGEGYARLDFRLNQAGQLFFLDINFACSLFYPEGYEGSADYILKHDPMRHSGFLRHIIEEGIQRHRKKRKKYERRGNAISGFGIFATEDIPAGHTVFRGEERTHRMVTRGHVERSWPAAQVELFRRYAIPAGGEVYLLWDEDPEEWAPQNHSCDPNTAMTGLNLVAIRDVKAGEELTIDYATICDEQMTPFLCTCGFPRCRKYIRVAAGSSPAWQRD